MADPVWLLVMYDLPVVTPEERHLANLYRLMLYDHGFSQVQYSVYSKYLTNASGVRTLLPPIREAVPPGGEVRVLRLTDQQWASMDRFYGREPVPAESPPTQLELLTDEEIEALSGNLRQGRARERAKRLARKPSQTPDMQELWDDPEAT